MGLRNFASKYMLTIVMVPAIIGFHYGWLEIQKIDSLVKPEERKLEMPIYSIARKWLDSFKGATSDDAKK